MQKRRILWTVLIMCMILVTESVAVFADPSIDELTDERDETQEELDEVNATIEELAAQQGDVLEEIEQVNDALVQILTEISVIELQLEEKEVQIEEAQAAYLEAAMRETEQYNAMVIRIQYLYESGDPDLLSIYMETGSIAETLVKADYIEDLYEYDRQQLATYQATVEEVSALKTQLEQEQAELLELQAVYEEEQAYMEEVMLELQEISDSYDVQLAEAEALAQQYADQIAAQNAEIARLEEEERRAREEAERRAREEAMRQAAANSVANSANTGTVTTTSSSTYDVSSIYAANGSELGKSIAVFACQFIGNPYVPGGTSLTDGADCSGFVFSVYREFGYSVPRTSYALRSAGVEVSYEDAQPGDIICYPGHVAIYIGNGMIVHASSVRTGIKVSRATYREMLCVRRII